MKSQTAQGQISGIPWVPQMSMAENKKLTPDGEFFLFKTNPSGTGFSFLSPLTGI